MDLHDTLTAFLVTARSAGCTRLVVAYSGGIDSHVLLDKLNQLNNSSIQLDAIYINHNLQKQSKLWGDHCQLICQQLDVGFKQIDVEAKPTAGESPEEKARLVRYQALANELQPHHWLLTAQHLDDQAETVLLQLLRGAGVAGLSAMPFKRTLGTTEHYRPLLGISKQEIENYAKQQQLKWIEDPSNQDQNIARNYIRNSVIPVLKKQWPETPKMISRSADWLSEASILLTDIADQDAQNCCTERASINLSELAKLSHLRQKNLLRHWFYKFGLKSPGDDKLRLIFEQIISAKGDACPQLDWQGISLRRYQQHLYILPKWPAVDSNWCVQWNGKTSINLPDGWATLHSTEVIGFGLSHRYLQQPLTLQLRKGGEICQPVERNRSRSLKKLFQEYSVPPWLRQRWPLLYSHDQLIAVPGLFICKGHEATTMETGLNMTVNLSKPNTG